MKKNTNPKFTSKYDLDFPLYQEFSKYYLKSNKSIVVILSVLLFCFLLNLLFQNYDFVWKYALIILSITFLFLLIIKRNIHLNYKRMITQRGEENVSNTITITKENITITDENKNHTTYSFDQFISIIETPNLLILKLKYNLGLIISKKDLKGGSISDLKNHLLTNCLYLKKNTIINPQKYNKFISLSFILFFLILLIALVLSYHQNNFIRNLQNIFERDGYIFNNMYPGKYDDNVYEIFKNDSHTIVYIYEYENEKFATINFNDWLDPDNTSENFTCQKKNDYEICTSSTPEYYSKLLLKDRFVIYGSTENIYQSELDTITSKIITNK